MDKDKFQNLFLNANTILYVSMQETLAGLAGEVVTEAGDVSANAGLVKTGLESLDLDALAKAWDNAPEPIVSAEETPHDGVASSSTDGEEVQDEDLQSSWLELDASAGVDYTDYMQRVYQEPSLNDQMNRVYDKVDTLHVNELFSKLPQDATNLGEKLTGVDLQQWIAINRQGNAALRDLALYIRHKTIEIQAMRA